MDVKRRSFVKGFGAAACVLLLPVGASASTTAAKGKKTNKTPADLRIEKSIKANFGGGFAVLSHTQSGGLTRANIENFGNRYEVTSSNLLDWEIVGSSLNN